MIEVSLRSRVVAQFGHPRGALGWLAGRIMLSRGSNRNRTRWAVSMLDPLPTESILEIGFGPGYALELLAARAFRGLVAGVDHSELMVNVARRRTRRAPCPVELRCAPVSELPDFGVAFDKVLAVNCFQFWPDPVMDLAAVRQLMRPDGLIALVIQPRNPGATAATTKALGDRLRGYLGEAGFKAIRLELNEALTPVPAVAALARA